MINPINNQILQTFIDQLTLTNDRYDMEFSLWDGYISTISVDDLFQ